MAAAFCFSCSSTRRAMLGSKRMQSSLSCSSLKRFRFVQLHQIVSFDPLEHVVPCSAPGVAWIKTWTLRKVLMKVVSELIPDSEDTQ